MPSPLADPSGFNHFLARGGADRARGVRLRWLQSLEGLVRVPIVDVHHSDWGYVITYVEKRRTYEALSFRVANGKIRWRREVTNGGYGAPAQRGSQLIVLSGFTNVEALDTVTGRPLWRHTTASRIRSPVAVIDDQIVVTSGPTLYGLDEGGEIERAVTVTGVFFFGLCARGEKGAILTLGTKAGEGAETSRIYLFAVGNEGVHWITDLGEGNVASSDTCGVQRVDDSVYVTSPGAVWSINVNNGDINWRSPLPGIGHRSICTSSDSRLFATTVEGHVTCYDSTDGTIRWSRLLSAEGIWMPASVFGSCVAICAGGYLWLLDIDDGSPLQKVPVGQTPYSACSLHGETMLIGAGDPPYLGLLIALDLVPENANAPRAVLERPCRAEPESEVMELVVSVEGVDSRRIESVVMDLSPIGDSPSAEPYAADSKRSVFRFLAEPGVGRRNGVYALPVRVLMVDGEEMQFLVGLELTASTELPQRVLLADVTMEMQEQPNYSGAACMQALRGLYGEDLNQAELRRMVDAVLEKSGYLPFDAWRIITRRLLLGHASHLEELPEFRKQTPSP